MLGLKVCIKTPDSPDDFIHWLNHENIDIIIVDKKNDLNIYKEDTRKAEKDKGTSSASCCSSDSTKAAVPITANAPLCCASTQDSTKHSMLEEDIRGCCDTNIQNAKVGGKDIIDIDFNDWVGK